MNIFMMLSIVMMVELSKSLSLSLSGTQVVVMHVSFAPSYLVNGFMLKMEVAISLQLISQLSFKIFEISRNVLTFYFTCDLTKFYAL